MANWRDNASQETQDELDRLLNFSIPAAKHEIEKRSEFYPFGAVISHTGEPLLIEAQFMVAAMREEHPSSTDVLEHIYEAFQAHSYSIHAVAAVSDVKLTNGQDGIRVELEHRDGISIAVILPYVKRLARVKYGELQAAQGERHVWPAA